MRAEPEYPPVTCLAGQPMLMSMRSAPKSSATRAASAIQRAFAARKLNSERRDPACARRSTQHIGPCFHEFFARDHLGNNQACAKMMCEATKRFVRHAGHGREKNRVGEDQISNAYAHILGKPSV